MTQSTLSDLTDLDRTFISLIECGKRNPSLKTIEKISKVLGMEPWEMLKHVKDTSS